jgi:hypothetical protein
MLNSGKKIRALRDKKNKYPNSCVAGKKNSERNKKPHQNQNIFFSNIGNQNIFFRKKP